MIMHPTAVMIAEGMHHSNMSKSNLMSLPIEILHDILLRLPKKLPFQLQCVSKNLQKIVSSASFAALNSAAGKEPSQILILYEPPSSSLASRSVAVPALKRDGIYGPESWKEEALVLDISSIPRRYTLHCVSCGLLCFKDAQSPGAPALLMNPLRREVLKLPTCNVKLRSLHVYYGIGFDDTSSTYKIVQVSGRLRSLFATHVYELGASSSSWRRIPSVPPDRLSEINVSTHGKMHWLVSSGEKIISFDFKKEEFNWTSRPDFGAQNVTLQLLSLRGSLAIVLLPSQSFHYIDIWVLKNYDKKEWAKDYRLRVEFGVYESSNIGTWEHGIFIHNIGAWEYRLNHSKGVLFYNLRSRQTFHIGMVQERMIGPMKFLQFFSYTGGLISLKNYDNCAETEPGQRNFSYVPRVISGSY